MRAPEAVTEDSSCLGSTRRGTSVESVVVLELWIPIVLVPLRRAQVSGRMKSFCVLVES